MKRLMTLSLLVLLAFAASVDAAPVIGAQVFIEPGQTPEQIDGWFRVLEENGFEYARIRMFGSHVRKPDGTWDFSLYDEAFSSAARHGVKLFATLFPVTDELNDVGGFKFPRDERHLSEIGEYIDHVVGHFKGAPALDTWVLQNEPGTGSLKVHASEFSDSLRKEWEKARPRKDRTGWLKADFSDQEFLVYYTEWYLRWIADRVMAIDPVHGRHINPHQILETLPEYDFAGYKDFITSLGSSMHYSWHFGAFVRKDYPKGLSMMTDIIAENALGQPYWITEFQGGNVTASGNVVLCPSADEVTQSIWCGVGAGVKGFMFWTLNQRKAVREAGEWGLLDFQGQPSDRMLAASAVAKVIKDNSSLFDNAAPYMSNVAILYNNESLWIQKLNSDVQVDRKNEGRGKDAVMKSVASAYSSICAMGVAPRICQMDFYDWSDPEGKIVILPDMICLPSRYIPVLKEFVRNGGRLVVTGLTGYYDENMSCSFMDQSMLKGLFGAQVSEFKAVGQYCSLPEYEGVRLDTHLWKGLLRLDGAKAALCEGDDVLASVYEYGEGRAFWLPSAVNLGCRYRKDGELASFYARLISSEIESPVRFASVSQDIFMRTMKSGDKYITVMINKGESKSSVRLMTKLESANVIFASNGGVVTTKKATLSPEETVVCVWNY